MPNKPKKKSTKLFTIVASDVGGQTTFSMKFCKGTKFASSMRMMGQAMQGIYQCAEKLGKSQGMSKAEIDKAIGA